MHLLRRKTAITKSIEFDGEKFVYVNHVNIYVRAISAKIIVLENESIW